MQRFSCACILLYVYIVKRRKQSYNLSGAATKNCICTAHQKRRKTAPPNQIEKKLMLRNAELICREPRTECPDKPIRVLEQRQRPRPRQQQQQQQLFSYRLQIIPQLMLRPTITAQFLPQYSSSSNAACSMFRVGTTTVNRPTAHLIWPLAGYTPLQVRSVQSVHSPASPFLRRPTAPRAPRPPRPCARVQAFSVTASASPACPGRWMNEATSNNTRDTQQEIEK